MTVRPRILPLLASTALLLAGCGGSESATPSIESDDTYYQMGKAAERQGRNPEALADFLKVIERRGERNAPESHLEVGLLLQRQDPIAAIYHFNKYLELKPNSQEAPLVRGHVDTAKREFMRMLPGHPDEDQSALFDLRGQLERLQRENDQLKAELSTRPGGGSAPLLHVSRASTPEEPHATPTITETSPVSVAPPPESTARPLLSVKPAIPAARPATTTGKPTPATGKPAAPAGRKHTVAPHETLFGIARKYGVTVEAIAAANRDVLPTVNTTLHAGIELKIP